MDATPAFVKPEKTREADEVLAERSRPVRTGRVQPIEIDHILPNPFQPREYIDLDELKPLATSIKNYGFEGHLEVRRRNDRLELVSGHRRLRAAKMAGEKTVPTLVVDYSDEQMMEISLLENITRQDLTPWEEAQQIDLIRKRNQLSVRGMAKFIGKNKGWVENRLALLNLPKELQEEAKAGNLEVSTAVALDRMRRQGASTEEIEELVKAYKLGNLTGEQFLKIQKAHKESGSEALDDEGRRVRTVSLIDQVLREDDEDEEEEGPDPVRLASQVFIGRDGMMEIRRPDPVVVQPPTDELVTHQPIPQTGYVPGPIARAWNLPEPLPAQENRERLTEWQPETETVAVRVEHTQWSSGRDWALRVADLIASWSANLPGHMAKADFGELSPDELATLRASRDRMIDVLQQL